MVLHAAHWMAISMKVNTQYSPTEAVTVIDLQCLVATIPATLSIIFMVAPPDAKPDELHSEGCNMTISED